MRLPFLFAARSPRGLLLLLLGLVAGCDGSIAGPIDPGPGASGSGDCSDRYPLMANAGADRSADKNTFVTLSGAASVDPNGNGALTYRWSITSPTGGVESATGSTASFIPKLSGVYTASLVVSSACDTSNPDTVAITVKNRVPVANAGADQTVRKRSVVRPSGSASTDADRDTLSYAWSISSAPAGSNAALAGADTVSPTLVPEVPGVYLLSLVVSDGESTSPADTVQVTVFNTVPVAQAGADQESMTRSTVTLSGVGTDADGDALGYQWSFASRPAGSSVALTGAASAAPSFVPDVEGRYELDLVVHDGTDPSPADRVVVTVYRYIHRLAYRVVDAEYSKALERVVSVSASPHTLHVYDPVAESETTVALALSPTCVAVSPDGRFAAVGHNARISYVDLVQGAVVGTPLSVSIPVGDVVLTATHAYAIPDASTGTASGIHTVPLNGGKVTVSTAYVHGGTRARLHPGLTAIYGADDGVSPEDLEKYSLSASTGVAQVAYDSQYHGTYPLWSNLWLTEDGARLIAASGRLFTTTPTATTNTADLVYDGALDGYTGLYSFVQWADHDADTKTLALIPGVIFAGPQDADTRLQLFTGDFLALQTTFDLPRFVLAGRSYAGRGRFVFHSSNGSRRFVLVQADATAGLALDQGFVAY